MLRPVLVLKLPESVRTKLQSLGYEFIEDLEKAINNSESMPTQLKAIIDEHKIAEKIDSWNTPFKIITAASLWHNEFCDPPIAVFHKGLDKLLGGGLPVGRITELCGSPGCGKTQMCLQFCVDVQIPSNLGGSAGEALYISTDFGFGVDRLSEIMEASIQHCRNTEFPGKSETLKNFTLTNLLNGVNVIQIYQLSDLISTLKSLKEFLETNNKIKLLIVDSFSLPLITQVDDLLIRSKITAEMLDILLDNAMKYKFAVVLTNQLATIITPNNKAILKPSLGEGFGHRLHQRLLLDNGKIFLTKSIKHSQTYTCFEITKDGIR